MTSTMLEELKYFIRESGTRSAVLNGISMMSKLSADSLALNLPLLNSLEWIPKMRPFPLRCHMSLVLGRNPFWHLVGVAMEKIGVQIKQELRHCVNLVSGNQQMFRMCALQHYCGAYITLPLFMAMNFEIEEIKCSHQRNIRKKNNKTAILGIYLP